MASVRTISVWVDTGPMVEAYRNWLKATKNISLHPLHSFDSAVIDQDPADHELQLHNPHRGYNFVEIGVTDQGSTYDWVEPAIYDDEP